MHHILFKLQHFRSAETLTLDDLIFCGPIVKLFVQYLQNEIKHGGSTIMQYSKAMLDCLEWVQKQKDMRIGKFFYQINYAVRL